jgi:hypothetical protein
MECSRDGAKLRIASSHDIFIGHGSIYGWSKTGRRKSSRKVLLFAREGLDFRERIFSTIAQD